MGTHTVLVIDDESAIRFAVRLILEDAGYAVSEAPDGLSGMELLREACGPRVVVLDLMLPGMSGVQLLARAARDPLMGRHRYVVVTAARAFPVEELTRYLPPGHLSAVPKPFDLDHLVGAVERAEREVGADAGTDAGEDVGTERAACGG